MELEIRAVRSSDIAALVDLALLAWRPVYASFRDILGPDIYPAIWPDWKANKRRGIARLVAEDSGINAFVAVSDGAVVGFISYRLDVESRTGTVQYLAVHPNHQRKGVGTELNRFALDRMKESGMRMAVAETGGDRSHVAARRSYEKAGYTGLPLVRYFKML